MMHQTVVALDEQRADLARAQHVDVRASVHSGERLAMGARCARARRRDEAAHVEATSEDRSMACEHVEVERIGEQCRRLVGRELVEHARHHRLGPERRVLARVEVQPRPFEALLVAGVSRAT